MGKLSRNKYSTVRNTGAESPCLPPLGCQQHIRVIPASIILRDYKTNNMTDAQEITMPLVPVRDSVRGTKNRDVWALSSERLSCPPFFSFCVAVATCPEMANRWALTTYYGMHTWRFFPCHMQEPALLLAHSTVINRQLTKDKIVNSILVIRKMQVETTMRYHFIAVTHVKIVLANF